MNQQNYLNQNMLNWNRGDMKLAWLCSEYTIYINRYVIYINEPVKPSKQKHDQRKRRRHEACVTLQLRTTPTHHPPILPTPVQWKWEIDCVCIENRKPPPLEGRSLLPSWNLATWEVAKTTKWLFSWEILTRPERWGFLSWTVLESFWNLPALQSFRYSQLNSDLLSWTVVISPWACTEYIACVNESIHTHLHTHTNTHMWYIWVCVCLCVCASVYVIACVNECIHLNRHVHTIKRQKSAWLACSAYIKWI